MRFKFNKNLEYQLEAVKSITDIFDTGENLLSENREFKLEHYSKIIPNELEIDAERILKNILSVQKSNKVDIQVSKTPVSMNDFSIEMETGTGKTYVYLRTIFELNKLYNLKKFIVLVPSVAIREGVLKTLEQTKTHFKELYNVGYNYFAYDSNKLSRVSNFTSSLDLQIMIMTIQSFNSDDRVMRSTPDRFNSESPIDLVAQTNPVVIMDEPQNMESELSRSAINDLNPLFKLRYSATHKTKHNLMYSLTPVDSYRMGLVKKIEVYGVESSAAGDFVFKVREIVTQKGKAPTTKVMLEVKNAGNEFLSKEMTLKAGDDLRRKTNNDEYEGLIVNEISAQYGRVELSDGKYYKLEEELVDKKVIFRAQIRETIKAHFEKQEKLGENIKVLSLFFIDKVANYVSEDGLIRQIFIEEYEKLKQNYGFYKDCDVDSVHKGYFANAKEKGQITYKDTTGKTKADKDAYDLIMKEKERLLSFSEPVSFIFSHSALKEGWDNPNIFQICTLRETKSEFKKRQEIGRGMRLCVDINGDRVLDPSINVLTVIPNESYKEFVGSLQTEYNEAGYREAPQAVNARDKIKIRFKKHLESDSEDFKNLWERIRKRTRYNIEINSAELIENAVKKINELDMHGLVIRIEKVEIDFDDKGKIKTVYEASSVGGRLEREITIGNVCDRISKETGITKKTAFEILSCVENFDLIFENPEEYIRSVIVLINGSLNDLLVNEGLKYLPTGDFWEISLFESFETGKSRTIESEKSAYDHVVFDSDGEKEFAQSLERSESVKVFVKLPPQFVVETPLGTYNPDWAIVWHTEEGDKLYLVRETKFDIQIDQLRDSEKKKIQCGRKHFESIGVDFDVSQDKGLRDLIS